MTTDGAGVPVVVDGYPPFDAESGATLLEACEEVGIPMDSACGGFAACNACRVEVTQGLDSMGPVGEEEACFLDAPGQRLGCQAIVGGPVRFRLAPGM